MYIGRTCVPLLKRLHQDLIFSSRPAEMLPGLLGHLLHAVFLRCGEVYKTTLIMSSYLTGILRLSQIKHCEPGLTLLYIVGPP